MFRVIPKHIKAFCGYCQCLPVFLNYITADSGDSFYKQLLIMPEHDNISSFN